VASEKTAQIAQCIASGSSTSASESVALAVAVFAFIGAAMWVFHRYGQRSEPLLELQPAGAPALAAAPS
jgi:flagellar biogenesis protein FliO